MSKCCDANEIFGEDNHSIECEEVEEEGYDPEPNKSANKLWEAR